jgi:trimethylamine--corrinoid protein Co-methyltransferase
MSRATSRRRERPQRIPGALQQRPWKQFTLPYRPIEVLSADQVEAIHDTALTILEEIGMKVLEPRAPRPLWRGRRHGR